MKRDLNVLLLRGSDPTLLEVQLPDVLRQPLGAIHIANVMDVVELSETAGRPRSLDKALQAFVDGLRRQVNDIPNGRAWEIFLEDLGTLSGKQVPHTVRKILVAQAELPERQAMPLQSLHALLAKWEPEEPEPFLLSQRSARIQRAEAVQPKAPASDPSTAPRERAEKKAGSRAASAKSAAPRAPKPVTDIERREFVVEQCLERLARTTDKGLNEAVLVAGVRHASRETYPDMTPLEITTVLRQLRDGTPAKVRSSAGRWMMIQRF